MKKLLLLFCLSLAAVRIFAADGNLDASFGTGGKVLTASTTSDYMEHMALQPDGKIVAAGYSSTSRTTFTFSCLLVRYNADGAVDESFNANGRFAFSPSADSCQLFDVRVQPDGKIVAAGVSNNNKIFVMRLTQNGSLDASFDGDGYNNSTTGFANSLEIEPATGKIVVGGAILSTSGGTRFNFAMLRFNPNGSLDPTFDGDGIVTTPIGTASISNSEGVTDFKIRPDGKYVGVGTTANATALQNLTVVRYNNDGSLDTTLGGVGYIVKTIANTISTGLALDVQTDGKIVTVGSSDTASRTVARFNTDGSMDASFGNAGFAFAPAGGDNFFELLIQPDGKILTAGRKLQATATGQDFYVVRLNSNGSPDATFGTGGVVFTNFSTGNTDEAKSVLLQPDGKIIVGGISYAISPTNNTPYIFALARYQNSLPISNASLKTADFDGDGKTDASVFRNGTWFINPSSSPTALAPQGFYGIQFGLASDKLAPADYDGDGKTDIAVWRSDATRAYFYILNSSNNTVRAAQFGKDGDLPVVVGDWDGDGKADPAVYRDGAPNGGQSAFYYRPSAQTNVDFIAVNWGAAGDKPVRGDFDGDGKFDAAVFRPADNLWYIRQSSNGNLRAENWGVAADKLVPADYDGDGKSDLAVFRNGIWYIKQSSNSSPVYRNWGLNSDALVPGDYDGDGRADAAVWRAGVFYILNSSSNSASYQNFGGADDFPVTASFNQ